MIDFLISSISSAFILKKVFISFMAKFLKISDKDICFNAQYFFINSFSFLFNLNSILSSSTSSLSSLLNNNFNKSFILYSTLPPLLSAIFLGFLKGLSVQIRTVRTYSITYFLDFWIHQTTLVTE